MRIIQKQISLEPMTSRLPSVWPAYKDNRLYFFDEESLERREWLYTSNWGMVPVNIVISPKPYSSHTYSEYTVIDGCHCYGNLPYDELCEFVLSFENLSKWYYFFNEYYNLLKQYSHCDRVYTSAEDYYNYESLTKYADQMKYGADKQTYLDLDKEFAEKGGRVEVQIYNKDTASYSTMTPEEAHDEFDGDRMLMTDVYDIGFFKWICENVVPSFTIPMIYRNYWKKDTLFYPDVIKWLQWFKNRVDIYDEDASNIANFELERGITELWDCKADGVTDCCDCEEYFNRGGERIYNLMKEWYERIQKNILKSVNSACTMPTVILPAELQVSIDDLGEFSIFSKEYELGKDYRVAHYGDSANTYGGTVTVMNGESMYLEGGQGYTFNRDYMEKYVSSCRTCGYEGVFSYRCPKCQGKDIVQISYDELTHTNIESGWSSYTERYITDRDNRREFFIDSGITFYAFNENNVKFEAATLVDLQEQMTKRYQVTTRDFGWYLINGKLYEVKSSEASRYDKTNQYLSGNTYIIYREEYTRTPYTFINGKKIFADFYPPTNVFYFPFFPSDNAESDCSGKTFNINNYKQFSRFAMKHEDIVYYIEYGSDIHLTNDNGRTASGGCIIDGIEYPWVSSISVDDVGNELYIIDEKVMSIDNSVFSNNLIEYRANGYEINYEDFIIEARPNIEEDCIFDIYQVNQVTGRTVSKISDLRLFNTLVDDVGNTIEGIYEVGENEWNHQPPEGTELELIYQVGNTTNIKKFSMTEDDMDDIIENANGEALRNYFVGDIITNMTFYYKDYDGNIVKQTEAVCNLTLDDEVHLIVGNKDKQLSGGYSSLSAITESTEIKKELESSGLIMQDDIYCDITYYVGATLSRMADSIYNLASIEERDDACQNHGVMYKETVRFVKTNQEYYLKKPSDAESTLPTTRNMPCKHSVSYPIYVYVLTQDMEKVNDTQYNIDYSVPMANFVFDINVYRESGREHEIDYFGEAYKADMERHNGLHVYPTYKEEYRFGISSMENVDSDIYIDRGINAAFEKHIKLGEVTSLEALINYGNNFFKIMEN